MARADGRGRAPARAALAGNPSDGYGGAVLAVALEEFAAEAVARVAPALSVSPPSELVSACLRRFAAGFAPEASRTAVEWGSSIPRGVGLGGSSAIVIAVLRALCSLYEVVLEPVELAELALAIETEDLGIAGGLQDRIAQSFGVLTFMDFASGSYERLDPRLLPPLVVAWRTVAAEHSGVVHAHLRARFDAGDEVVVGGMAELGAHARRARNALVTGAEDELRACVDGSFDARRRLLALDPRHVEMIERARAEGASANYTGSGGAVVAVCRGVAHRSAVAGSLRQAGCGVMELWSAIPTESPSQNAQYTEPYEP
jgi:glucuronokinase